MVWLTIWRCSRGHRLTYCFWDDEIHTAEKIETRVAEAMHEGGHRPACVYCDSHDVRIQRQRTSLSPEDIPVVAGHMEIEEDGVRILHEGWRKNGHTANEGAS